MYGLVIKADFLKQNISKNGIRLKSSLSGGVFGFSSWLLFRRNLQSMILIHDAQGIADGFVAAIINALVDEGI